METAKLADTIEKYEATYLYTTPCRLMDLTDLCQAQGRSFPSLERIIVGTERMPLARLKDAIAAFGPIISVGYGMVEVLPPLSLLAPQDYGCGGDLDDDALTSVGRLQQGVDIKIMDEGFAETPSGTVGKIWLRSATLSPGYFSNDDLNRHYFQDGWFHSDDYGYLDAKGFLHIMGRKQQILSRKDGLRFAVELEDKIYELAFVSRAAAVLRGDRIRLAICLVPGTDTNQAKAEILDFCKSHVDECLIPNDITILDRLPLTFLGKLDRKAL
jgi:acyl-CoA synthetase (AMP-forming)/AMP-acid ligase II